MLIRKKLRLRRIIFFLMFLILQNYQKRFFFPQLFSLYLVPHVTHHRLVFQLIQTKTYTPSKMSGILFEDMFVVDSVDPARYNKVSRIEGQSSTSLDIKITLDINSELFPVKENDSLTITLASTLGNESSMTTSNGSWRPPKKGDRSLADDYDYVMYGTVYKFEESSGNDKMAVYISFGGLLMRLEGGYRSLSSLKQENAYILIRHYKDN